MTKICQVNLNNEPFYKIFNNWFFYFSTVKVESFLRKLPGKRPLVVLISEAGKAVAIAEHLKHVKLPSDPIWLIGSLGLDLRTLSGWRKVFHGGFFVEPHMPELSKFKKFFVSSLEVIKEISNLTLWASQINSDIFHEIK
jgi:hypothetical protein